MKIKPLLISGALLLATAVWAQTPPPPGGSATTAVPGKNVIFMRGEAHGMHGMHGLGAFWKDSATAGKLGLADSQKQQLEDAFYQHRLKMVDMKAEMEKQDLKLEQMLNAENVDDAAVSAQADAVNAARGNMAKEFTMMSITFRHILSLDQWKQLQQLRNQKFRMMSAPGMPLPPPPPGALLITPGNLLGPATPAGPMPPPNEDGQ